MSRHLIIAACLSALLFGGAFAGAASAADGSSAAERAKVPAFQLKDLKGKRVHIKDLKGKVVMISFWATWCVPCKRELDDLKKLYKKHKGDGFEVLAIAIVHRSLRGPFADSLTMGSCVVFLVIPGVNPPP